MSDIDIPKDICNLIVSKYESNRFPEWISIKSSDGRRKINTKLVTHIEELNYTNVNHIAIYMRDARNNDGENTHFVYKNIQPKLYEFLHKFIEIDY